MLGGLDDVLVESTRDPEGVRVTQQPHRMQGQGDRIGRNGCHSDIVSGMSLSPSAGPPARYVDLRHPAADDSPHVSIAPAPWTAIPAPAPVTCVPFSRAIDLVLRHRDAGPPVPLAE